MAEKKVYIGSEGPFLFDDTDTVDDPDGDFAGLNQKAITAEQLQITSAPSGTGEVVRWDELIADARRYSVLASPTVTGFEPKETRNPLRYSFMMGG